MFNVEEIVVKSEKASEKEIFSRLARAAEAEGIVLTYTNKLFFLRLLNFAEQAEYDEDGELTVDLSVQGLSEALRIPLRTSIQSLSRLTACGALCRIEGKKTFPRSSTITTINKIYYLKD